MPVNKVSKPSAAKRSSAVETIVKKTVAGSKERLHAVHQLQHEGPAHKLLQNEWLFEALQQLVKSVEKQSGKKMENSIGSPLVWAHKKERMEFPVPLPFKKDAPDIQLFTEGPEHETLMYSMALQVIHWAANTVTSAL